MNQTQPDNYDPPENERKYYRNSGTADRGYLVRRDGKDAIRYDRPMQELVTKNIGDWVPETDEMPAFSRHQIGQIAFAADKALCMAMGDHDKGRRDWLALTEKARLLWVEKGPTEPTRQRLYDSIFKALE